MVYWYASRCHRGQRGWNSPRGAQHCNGSADGFGHAEMRCTSSISSSSEISTGTSSIEDPQQNWSIFKASGDDLDLASISGNRALLVRWKKGMDVQKSAQPRAVCRHLLQTSVSWTWSDHEGTLPNLSPWWMGELLRVVYELYLTSSGAG